MSFVELSLLRRLHSEVAEISSIDKAAGNEALKLLKSLVASSADYCCAVTRQEMARKRPDNADRYETEAWQNEFERTDRARRSSHEALITDYKVLGRYCRGFRKKDLSIESKFPPEADRAIIGDMAQTIRRGVNQARDTDEVLYAKLSRI